MIIIVAEEKGFLQRKFRNFRMFCTRTQCLDGIKVKEVQGKESEIREERKEL